MHAILRVMSNKENRTRYFSPERDYSLNSMFLFCVVPVQHVQLPQKPVQASTKNKKI